MLKLKVALQNTLKKIPQHHREMEQRCRVLWPTVAGPNFARHTTVERARNGILFVIASSSTWACELKLYKEKFLEELNQRLGRPLLKDLWVRVGEVPEVSASHPPLPSQELPPIPKDRQEAIQKCLRGIPEEYQDRVRSLLEREEQRRLKRLSEGWKRCLACGALHPGPSQICPYCRLGLR